MIKEQINEYSLRITQANRTQIVVITYDIILNYLDSAEKSIDNNKDDFVFNLRKARQFLNQLSSALDFRYSISIQLMNLYMYANSCLLESELKRTDVNLAAVRNIIEKMKVAFEQISAQDTSKPVMNYADKVYAGLTYGKDAQGTVMVSK